METAPGTHYTTGSTFLALFGMVNLVWSLRLWASAGAIALITAISSLLAIMAGLLIYIRC